MKVRYPLWGIDESIRILTRLPDWIEHNRGNGKPANVDLLMKEATALRAALDQCIRRAFAHGRAPSWWERQYLAWRVSNLQATYERCAPFDAGDEDEDDTPGLLVP